MAATAIAVATMVESEHRSSDKNAMSRAAARDRPRPDQSPGLRRREELDVQVDCRCPFAIAECGHQCRARVCRRASPPGNRRMWAGGLVNCLGRGERDLDGAFLGVNRHKLPAQQHRSGRRLSSAFEHIPERAAPSALIRIVVCAQGEQPIANNVPRSLFGFTLASASSWIGHPSAFGSAASERPACRPCRARYELAATVEVTRECEPDAPGEREGDSIFLRDRSGRPCGHTHQPLLPWPSLWPSQAVAGLGDLTSSRRTNRYFSAITWRGPAPDQVELSSAFPPFCIATGLPGVAGRVRPSTILPP